MIESLALILVGFSIVVAPILLVAYLFFLRDMGKSTLGYVVCAAMIWFPEILADMSDAAHLAYASSTLSSVDVDARLATGFRSQSNFYSAFREITGMSPGTWRKRSDSHRSASGIIK